MTDLLSSVSLMADVFSGNKSLADASKEHPHIFKKKRRLGKCISRQVYKMEQEKEREKYLGVVLNQRQQKIEGFCLDIIKHKPDITTAGKKKNDIFILQLDTDKNWFSKRLQYRLDTHEDVKCKSISSFSKQRLCHLGRGEESVLIINYIRHIDGEESHSNPFRSKTIPDNLKSFIVNHESVSTILVLVNKYPTSVALGRMSDLKDDEFEFIVCTVDEDGDVELYAPDAFKTLHCDNGSDLEREGDSHDYCDTQAI
jgi:hypothetical protein